MRKRVSKMWLLMGIVFILVALTNATTNAQDKIILTLADSTSPTGLRGKGVKIFIEEVKKHTQDRVNVEVYWGQSLLKAKEILSGVKDGIVDMGFVLSAYYPKQMMVHGAFELIPQGPLTFKYQSSYFYKCFEEIPAFGAELSAFNQIPIYMNTALSLAVASTKPITKFEDFKGKRIRASSRWYLGQLKAAGAIPVSIPFGDLYMSLQTGTIDGVYTGLDGIHRTKLDEVARNVFALREIWAGVPFLYTINKDKWNKLPKDIQEQLLSAGKVATSRFADLFQDEWNRTIAEQKKQGCTVTIASTKNIQKWVTMPIIGELQSQWVQESEAAGVKNADKIINRMKVLASEAIDREKQQK